MPLAPWESPEYSEFLTLGSKGEPIFPFSLDQYLDNLGAYNTCAGNDLTLELARMLALCGTNFVTLFRSVPNGVGGAADLVFTPRQTKRSTVNVPPGSFLAQVTAIALTDVDNPVATADPAIFAFNVYDRGAHMSIAQGGKVNGSILAANFINVVQDTPAGAYFPRAPIAVSPPGQLTVEITSLAAVNITAQVLLAFAVPNTTENAGVVEVRSE